MGDLGFCPLPAQNSVFPGGGGRGGLCRAQDLLSIPPLSIPEEAWLVAEQLTHEIVSRIQPTVAAEEKRKEVVEYIRSLIKDILGYEVVPYGSVPLKTYLRDGDIDFTALSNPSFEHVLVSDVHAILSREAGKEGSKFQVKEVHRIDAEVKLVKCLVGNVVVDISFNQFGGLCTLCFLEQVDQLVGKNHLFKRSIILIKAWCYYESRTLGAQYGLLSTYALEILVLYIFHLFHSSLNGPLCVLYKFLDYYSKFDWENYCISLNGPVPRYSQACAVVEESGNGKGDLLLSAEFIRTCVQMFSVQSTVTRGTLPSFSWKYLNIIDPMKENNNLGRSVSRGNFYRIRSAFKFGAQKLGQILSSPRERVTYQLREFFASTLERNASSNSPARVIDSVQDIIVASMTRNSHSSAASFSPLSIHDPAHTFGDSDGSLSFLSSDRCQGGAVNLVSLTNDLGEMPIQSGVDHVISSSSNNSRLGHGDGALSGGNTDVSKMLLDLAGDYDSHLFGVLYCQYYHCLCILQSEPEQSRPSWLDEANHLNAVKQSISSHRSGYLQIHRNSGSDAKSCHISSTRVSAVAVPAPLEGKRAHRGTGTYIPNMVHLANRYRQQPSERGGYYRWQQSGGPNDFPCMRDLSRESSYNSSFGEHPALCNQNPAFLSYIPYSSTQVFPAANGFNHSLGIQQFKPYSIQLTSMEYSGSAWVRPDTLATYGSEPSHLSHSQYFSNPGFKKLEESDAEQAFHLMNDADFPSASL